MNRGNTDLEVVAVCAMKVDAFCCTRRYRVIR